MILVDANILLYAYDAASPQHRACRIWFEDCLNRQQAMGFAWATLLAFLRISTDGRVYRIPRTWDDAEEIVSSWLQQPSTFLLGPGDEHWTILRRVISMGQARGPLIMDAHLAALAIEHGAALCTCDRDFSRFPGLRLVNPLENE